jgi:hypothetical protein
MTIARTVSLGLAIMILLGVGAVSLSRGQQTGDKAAAPARARRELRERVLTLRTEIDLLQLDLEADRAALVELLQQTRKAEEAGSGSDSAMKATMIIGLELTGDAEIETELSKAIFEDSSENGMKKLVAKAKDEISKGIERRKKEFAKKARFLNEKKLDLEESETKYTAAPKS